MQCLNLTLCQSAISAIVNYPCTIELHTTIKCFYKTGRAHQSINFMSPQTRRTHVISDVGLELEGTLTELLCLLVLCSILQLHNHLSSSHSQVNQIKLWSHSAQSTVLSLVRLHECVIVTWCSCLVGPRPYLDDLIFPLVL